MAAWMQIFTNLAQKTSLAVLFETNSNSFGLVRGTIIDIPILVIIFTQIPKE